MARVLPGRALNARLAATGVLPRQAVAGREGGSEAAPAATRRIRLAKGAVTAPVHRFETLAPGQAVAGPAIVESDTTTVLLRPGDAARMDARGWLEIAVPADGAGA